MNNFLKRFFTTSATKQRVLDTQQSQREKWGEHQKSQSGSQWFLGRYLGADNHRITNTDSKIFLEELGFTILGIENQWEYAVEPSKGFTMKHRGGDWFSVTDAKENHIFDVRMENISSQTIHIVTLKE